MKKILLTFVFSLFFLSAVFCQSQSGSSDPVMDINAFIQRAMATNGSPGMSVSVVQGNRILLSKGYGFANREKKIPVTDDTLFYIASTTKSFTALTGELLALRGKIDLDAPVSNYLPGVALAPPLSFDAIKVRDLLCMTHGINADGPVEFRTAFTGDFTNDVLLQLIRLHPPLSTGNKFVYSNLGYNLFGLVLDSQFKEGWKSLIEREVLQPAKMQHTTSSISHVAADQLAQPYKIGDNGQMQRVPYGKTDSNMHAAGGHVSSANDLARYLILQLNGGKIDGMQVFPKTAIDATHTKQTDQDRMFGSFHRTGWALGWDIGTYGNDVVFHRFGGFAGFFSHVSFMPEHGIGVVVLVNGGDAASHLSDLVATYIYERLLEHPDVASKFENALTAYVKQFDSAKSAIAKKAIERASRQQQTALPLNVYTGTYTSFALGDMVWTMVGNRLHVKMGAASSDVEAYDASKNQFRVELTGSGEIVTFGVPAGAHAPARLTYSGYTFERK